MADAVDALYVMFDADIMAAEWVPGFYRAEPGGLSREEVLERLACVMETGKVGRRHDAGSGSGILQDVVRHAEAVAPMRVESGMPTSVVHLVLRF